MPGTGRGRVRADDLVRVVPAAVLMATVFTVTSLTRHAELTAAKSCDDRDQDILANVLGIDVASRPRPRHRPDRR